MPDLAAGAPTAAPARLRAATALPALGVGAIWLFLAVFLVYPLLRVFYDAFSDEAGRLTLANFVEFARDGFYRRSLWNSLVLGLGTVATTSLLGFAIAFLLVRCDFRGRDLFGYLTLLPIVSPPLVGVLGFTFILGRAGTVNVLLMDAFDLAKPLNFVYGVHGVLLVQTLHLFPMITLNVVDALGKIDPALEEAAESVGARGWRKLRTITLPLTTPGYVAGALLVFIWTFSDFATPLVLGVHDLLAAQAYLNIVQFVDRRLFRMGIVISAIMVGLAVLFLVAARQFVAIKDYSSLSYSRIARRRLSPLAQTAVVAFLSVVMLLAFLPYLGVLLASVGKGWALTPLPVHYTFQHFERVIVETPRYIRNSLLYASLAVLLCIVVGVPIAWILARTRLPGRGHPRRAEHAHLGHSGNRHRNRVHPGFPRGRAWPRAPAHELLDHLAPRAGDSPVTLHGARLLCLTPAGASLNGGGRRQRRRLRPAHVWRRHPPADLARGIGGRPFFLHDIAARGLGRALPVPRRVGDHHGRHLLVLHRRERERGRRARSHPRRCGGGESARRQPHRGHQNGGHVRLGLCVVGADPGDP